MVLLSDPPTHAPYQPPLISTWANTPLDWIKMHPKFVLSSFLGASILPQETNDGYGRLSRHIPGKMSELMEFLEYVQAHLDDLLCI
jgi:hypothetical protein